MTEEQHREPRHGHHSHSNGHWTSREVWYHVAIIVVTAVTAGGGSYAGTQVEIAVLHERNNSQDWRIERLEEIVFEQRFRRAPPPIQAPNGAAVVDHEIGGPLAAKELAAPVTAN